MNRRLDVTIDAASWKPATPPPAIARLSGSRDTDIFIGLLHTALWTRPPSYYGFHLSDLWAWLRYGCAIAVTEDLRLRPEWSDIDSHQKAVLSDEMGVGLTTQLFAEELGFLVFADTSYVVNVLAPGSLSLGRQARTGPKKSPDYICIDASLRPSILECKGTQTSHRALWDAVERGRAQKANVTARSTARIKYAIVAGLFIPQWSSSESARIHVSDPDPVELDEFLREWPPELGAASIVQIALAKHFALLGMPRLANFLASTPTQELRRIPETVHDEIRRMEASTVDGNVVRTVDLPATESDERETRAEVFGLRFSVRVPQDLLIRLGETSHLLQDIFSITSTLRERHWPRPEERRGAVLHTPLDFVLTLDWIES